MADQNESNNDFTPPAPQEEHKWLEQLLGDWTAEVTATCTPDSEPMTHGGKEHVRSLGGLWVICQGKMAMPGGGECENLMTLGYDPARKAFVGTFIAEVMTHQWIYEGHLSEDGKTLTLNTKGPDMTGERGLIDYQDIITIVSPDHRTLTSRAQQADGTWVQFMEAHYRRVK